MELCFTFFSSKLERFNVKVMLAVSQEKWLQRLTYVFSGDIVKMGKITINNMQFQAPW